MRDEKSRNAYKRYWRNRKNFYKNWEARVDATMAMNRSQKLMMQAEQDMITTQIKENSK